MTSASADELGSRYPRLQEYLGALPGGAAAYPDCLAILLSLEFELAQLFSDIPGVFIIIQENTTP